MGKRISLGSADAITSAVAQSRSIAGVLRTLGLRVAGGNYETVKRAVVELRLDTSHWTGQGHRKGSTTPVISPRPLEQVLVRDSFHSTNDLRVRLLRAGIFAPRCALCGLDEWLGAPMPLELDHIDGDRHNNELCNLRVVCPNCHAQTPTYRGKNQRRALR
jgi:hypothetical protein